MKKTLFIKKLCNCILDVIVDRSCIFCDSKKLNKKLNFICDDCLNSILIKPAFEICEVCNHPITETGKCPSCLKHDKIWYDKYYFIQYYTGFFRTILYKLKKEQLFIINKLFFHIFKENVPFDRNIPITVVPDNFYKKIKKSRSGLSYLLKQFKKEGYKTENSILKKRLIHWKDQKKADENERFSNCSKKFYLKKDSYDFKSREIFLIDDIYTTGSTLNYNAKLLKEAGFEKVYIVSFFRAIKGEDNINY